ncbi:MAG: SDR family oxidoreductase [Patescibacteria group bacterium]
MELKNKTILITGGARVGQFVAEELLAAGAKLAMTYVRDKSEVHTKAKGYQLDVTSEESVQELLPAVEKDLGQVDGLVNMISIFTPDPKEISYADMQKQFTINAFGNMLLSRLFAENAKQRGVKNAPIVSFIDWAVDHPYGNFDIYMGAKAALRHYLMSLQTTFAGVIRVVNIHPGLILEPPNFPEKQKESIRVNTPVKQIGSPEQAAKLVRTALELDFLVDNIRLAGGQQWRHRLAS